MLLEARGMEQGSQKFVQLWGIHVTGFQQERHCQYCLKGRKEPQIHRDMAADDYIYLLAMGREPRRHSNLHLVVKPNPGPVVSIGSLYGPTFTIRDARALRIDRLPKGLMGLNDLFTSCRNFQFGVQEFGYRLQEGMPSTGEHSLIPEVLPSCNS
jgi:hypothetical protein